MSARVLAVVVVLSVTALGGARAHAQSGASMTAAARDLYQQGVQAAGADRLDEAISFFERSYALSPRDATLLNLAQVQEQAGHLVAALDSYRRFLARADADMAARYGERARASVVSIEPRLAHVTVVTGGLQDGDEILLDGATLARESLGVSIPVDPGHHEVVVRRGQASCGAAAATLTDGASADLELDVVCALDPASLPPPETHDDTPLFIGLGVGGGVLVVGAIVLAVVLAAPAPESPMPFVGNVGMGTYATP
jgi:hypothetical protein